ncbi:MAG: hypothetical protein RL693_2080, partial [Verrucomicrobiota bacterium]
MKTNIVRGAFCSIIAIAALSSCSTTPTASTQGTSPITWTTSGKPTGKMDVLYVQNARSVSLEKGKLV